MFHHNINIKPYFHLSQQHKEQQTELVKKKALFEKVMGNGGYSTIQKDNDFRKKSPERRKTHKKQTKKHKRQDRKSRRKHKKVRFHFSFIIERIHPFYAYSFFLRLISY